MLTGMVNIAVFAAFRFCVGGGLRSDAEFKRVCRDCQLDVWCYGWQKRQETATMWQGGWQKRQDSAGFWPVHAAALTAALRLGYGCWGQYAVVKVLAAWGGALVIERIYHEIGELSRRRLIVCRPTDGQSVGG